MKLFDVLVALDRNNIEKYDLEDVRPNDSTKVVISFMCEEETWISTYSTHPILIPFYKCEVEAISPYDDKTIQIWLKYQEFLASQIPKKK